MHTVLSIILDGNGNPVNNTNPIPVMVHNGVSITERVIDIVANTDTVIANTNLNRVYLEIVNIGASDITLGVDKAAVLNRGIFIYAAGGGKSWDGPVTPINSIHAISSSNTTVVVWEG